MPVATPTCAAIAASFCLGSVIHGPNQPAANGMACKQSCEAADWGGLDRASSQASWPSGTRKPLTRPTPAPKPTADPGKSWTAVGSPSPASRRFDQRKILRTRRDPVGAARGLRVGRQDRRSREQHPDRERKRDFAHRSSPWICVSRLCFPRMLSVLIWRPHGQNGPPAHPKRPGMDNEALCVINFAYGLETVTTVPPTPL